MESSTLITTNGNIFRVTKEIPQGYSMWPVGDIMKKGYLPLCQIIEDRLFPGSQEINTKTLLCIKCDEARAIRHAMIYTGCRTIAAMKKRIQFKTGKAMHRRLLQTSLDSIQKLSGYQHLE